MDVNWTEALKQGWAPVLGFAGVWLGGWLVTKATERQIAATERSQERALTTAALTRRRERQIETAIALQDTLERDFYLLVQRSDEVAKGAELTDSAQLIQDRFMTLQPAAKLVGRLCDGGVVTIFEDYLKLRRNFEEVVARVRDLNAEEAKASWGVLSDAFAKLLEEINMVIRRNEVGDFAMYATGVPGKR